MITGSIRKLKSALSDTVDYSLPIGDELLPLNSYLGKTFSFTFTGNIYCAHCGNKSKTSFSQGYCFPCMKKLARCDLCILKPETCHYHLGTCREPEWGLANCFVPHYVYLSNTSGLKVGITRHTQIPTRWIDQGATQGTLMFKVNNRKQSGLIEQSFKQLIADKTNWRTMLKGDAKPCDLQNEAKKLKQQLEQSLAQILIHQDNQAIESISGDLIEINYPVIEYPKKITSLNLDKNPKVEGTLMGIKGQYLIFDCGVINMRKYTSYELSIQNL